MLLLLHQQEGLLCLQLLLLCGCSCHRSKVCGRAEG
jgi:hypothetical protein